MRDYWYFKKFQCVLNFQILILISFSMIYTKTILYFVDQKCTFFLFSNQYIFSQQSNQLFLVRIFFFYFFHSLLLDVNLRMLDNKLGSSIFFLQVLFRIVR